MPVISWLQIGIGAGAAFALSFLLHTVDVYRLEDKQRDAIAAQIAADTASCDKDKNLTKETDDGLQNQFTVIANKRDAGNGVQLPSCTPTLSGVSANTPTGGSEHARQNGLRTRWLRSYAAECETYRQERIALENFIAGERK